MVALLKSRKAVQPIEWAYPYDPSGNPQQLLLHSTRAKEKLYGGAAGGGKTAALMAETLSVVLRYGVTGLLLRRTFPGLTEIIERLMTTIPESIGSWNDTKKTWRFKNGGRLVLGFLNHDKDVRRYSGQEFGIIAWDELTHFTEWQYKRLIGHPLRVPISHPGYELMQEDGFKPYTVGATNPGDIGHGWVKGRFIDPAPPGILWQPASSLEELNPGTRIFIPAKVTDNPFMPSDYVETLNSLPVDLQRMYRDGDWDVYEGQKFSEFRQYIHVVEPEDFPVGLPSGGVTRGIGIDYGLDAPFCALWGALYPDNLIIVYRELYKAGLTPDEQAKLILSSEMPGERGPSRPVPAWIDPSTFTRPPNVKAKEVSRPDAPPRGSIAWSYRKRGVPVRKANNDRLQGVARVTEALRVRPDNMPRILIYSTCRDLIRTLPTLPRSKTNPEDVDTHAEDHAYDALRYLIMGMSTQSPAEVPMARGGRKRRATAPSRTITAGVRQRPL